MIKPVVIKVQNLSKVYKPRGSTIETIALENINLDIEEGDFVALAGPSGSGKTTLLNMMGTLDKPTSGDVLIENIPLSTLGPSGSADLRLRKIGFVFQAYNLISTLSALENAEYVALLQGVPAKRRRHEAFHILKDLGLEQHVDKRPSQLSAGQQQRVAVARAILAQPKIILADEPTANLDSKTGAELIDLMRAMGQNLNVTFVCATHDKMVMDKSRSIVTIHDGKIVSQTRIS